MSKSIHKETFYESIMSRLSSWGREWWHYLKSREIQAISRLWEYLSLSSFIIFIFIAILNILVFFPPYSKVLSPPGVLEQVDAMLTVILLGCVVIPFVVFFALVFILSLHPKTRKIADKRFGFRDRTELEELKVKVGNVENGLRSTDRRIDKIDKQIEEINSRLGNIEATLKILASKENEEGKEI